MAEPKYGRIAFAFPVESVSRKLTLRRNTASSTMKVGEGAGRTTIEKEISRYMGSGVRTIRRNDIGVVKKNYFFVRFNARTTPITPDEQQVRTLFSKASKLAARWQQDLASLADQQNAYNNHLPRKGVTSYGMSVRQFRFNVACRVLEDGGTVDSAWPRE